MKKLIIFAASVALSVAAFAGKPLPKEVKGTVTDTDGKPIAGVAVSDGFTVVLTDAEGKYCFPRVPAAYYVFVSVPAAYEVPLRQGQPCFFKKLA